MRTRRRDLGTFLRYARTIAGGFRWSLLTVSIAVTVGALVHHAAPHGAFTPWYTSLYASWMALFAQPLAPPETWYLHLVYALYPLFGFVLVGEGIVRFSLLMLSRQRGEKEWMRVMASTYRDHVVLCGLGHLGFRILDQLVAAGASVVGVEKDPLGRFVAQAKATGVPILIRDMKDDAALVEAGVERARCIVIATNDDIGNLEVALDARRLNPGIKILMRMFDQQIADKIKDAFAIDLAFSSAALAAPIVAAMTHQGRVLASFPVGGVPHMTAEVPVAVGGPLAGRSIAEVEGALGARVLAVLGDPAGPSPTRTLRSGEQVVLHAPSEKLAALLAKT